MEKQETLLLVPDSNLPFGIVGVAMLGADAFFFVFFFLAGHGAVKSHATHILLCLRGAG
jgi:hypothetical protein